jgi:hypothetical protein
MTGHRAVRLLLVCCALLANACSGAGAADAPPRLHVVRVNESSAEALAGARKFAEAAVESCRVTQHLSGGAAASLSDAKLEKIVFFQDEAFYDGDRIAHYTTHRFVVADAGSSCAPYVMVERDVTIADGCASRITARSGNDISDVGNPDASGGTPETQVERTGLSGDACVHKRKPVDATGLQADSAGPGANCVWRSRLLAARFGGLTKSAPGAGNGPAPNGMDDCLYQALPHYASAHSAGEDVVLRTHESGPAGPARLAQDLASGGHAAFEGNTRLLSFEAGGRPAARFDKAAADAFVRLPPKEAL